MLGVGELADIASTRAYPVAEFAESLLTALRDRGYGSARFDGSGFIVQLADDQGVLLVDRLHRELAGLPVEQRAQRLRMRLDAEVHPPMDSWSEAAPLLRSVLRPTSFTAAVTTPGRQPWLRRLWPFVNELAIVDTGAKRYVVSQEDTRRWGVTGEQMFAVARDNIAMRYPPQPHTEHVGHVLGDGSSYCDSAVLVPGWLDAFGGDGFRPLVFLPGDEVVLVCTDDPAVAPAFFEGAETVYREAAAPISPQAYTIRNGVIVAFDAVGPSPVRPLALRARSVLAEYEYRVQADRLAPVDTAVGAAQLVDTPRGICTATVWAQGTSWLLPAADYLMFAAGNGDQFTVPFGAAVDIAGLTPEPGLLPLRYRVTGWPDSGLLSVLRAHAVTLPGW